MGRVSDMAIGLQEEARDELLCEIDHWKERVNEAETLLRDCEEYFDQRADAEYFTDSPAPVGNEEMNMLTAIRAFLETKK